MLQDMPCCPKRKDVKEDDPEYMSVMNYARPKGSRFPTLHSPDLPSTYVVGRGRRLSV